MKSKNNSLAEIAAFLKEQPRLTLLCHQRPDGDTLGCAFGLKDCLAALGKEVKVLCADPISPRYRFLAEGEEWLRGEPEGAIVCLDIATPKMAGALEELALRADVSLDHHATNPYYGKMNYIDAEAAATGEIMTELAKLLGGISAKAAAAFYTAISTDTGCFKYGNTTARTHRAAAELAAAGIDLAGLNKWLFQTKSRAEFELERRAMEKIRIYEGGKLATLEISKQMLRETGAGADALEVISSLPIQLEGIVAAATFKELEEGHYKVSLRTNGSIHGGEVCMRFGGGGHCQAAGCSISGTYNEAEAQIIDALRHELERQG